MPAKYPHVVAAEKYAHDVVGGVIPACKWVKLACERHLVDKERRNWKWRFDRSKAEKICRFIERMPHVKGPRASKGEKIVLEPWQCFILCVVFGWVDRVSGLRRFRIVYIEVPRKNGKSAISSPVGLYMLCDDGEFGAECYSAATTRDQAKIVFDTARHMGLRSKGFRGRFGVDIGRNAISIEETASKFIPLSSEDSSLDGLNPNFACNDELHAHKTRAVYDVLETAMGAREQPLLWNITTAGTNLAGICYELHSYTKKILENVFEDDTFFGIIYTIDDGDDWTDPAIWAKANPNLGVSINIDDMARLCRKAQQMPSAQNNFLTKRLNVWCNADSAWMDMRAWDRCADPSLRIEDFVGGECIVALDLASKIDIAVRMVMFCRVIDGVEHFYFFAKHYVPEENVEENDNSQYDGWARSGHLTTTSGNIIDHIQIEAEVKELNGPYQVREVAYDPFNATQMAVGLQKDGFEVVEFGQTVRNFSDPMKQVEALVLAGRIHHNGDPVLTWMISNVVAHVDKKDNVFPNKERPQNKIDGAITVIMCMGRWMKPAEGEERSAYDDQDLVIA